MKKRSKTGLRLKRPVSLLNRPLKADFGGLFKAVARALAHGLTLKWEELLPDLAEAGAALGLKQDPAQLAWLLIRRSLSKAVFEIVGQTPQITPTVTALEQNQELTEQIDRELANIDTQISSDFFKSPGKLAIVAVIAERVELWLVALGVQPARAASAVQRLPAAFVYSLHREWRTRRDLYGPIVASLDSPFAAAAEREQEWEFYYSWLKNEIDLGVFGESFSLRQIYVPLRAFTVSTNGTEPVDRLESGARLHSQREPMRHVVDLGEHLDNWLRADDPTDTLRVVSGGPGSGKSSFAKIFAVKCLARTNFRVLFVPLHHFDLTADLEAAVRDYVEKAGFLSESPLDRSSGVDRLFLIFDGLDELGMLGKLAEEVARRFIHEVQRTLAQQNAADLRVQVLITGRELIVQANTLEFRRKGEILHLIPYYEPGSPKEQRESGFRDPKKLLAEDQRDAWWKRYGTLTGKQYPGLPAELKKPDLDEVTSQPLLNYLVALSYEGGKINFSQDVSLNGIYRDLLERIYERGWEDNRNPVVGKLTASEFSRVLEEIALAVWHGKGRTTTVKRIEEHCHAGGLTRLLEVFQEGAKGGITRLLTAFYFRERGTEGEDRAFEFTHKSFGEYLAARRLARMTRRIVQERERKREFFDEGWDPREALKHLIEICGPTGIDRYLLRFLRLEFGLASPEDAKKWQGTFVELLEAFVHAGMPIELIAPRGTHRRESHQERNATRALLLLMNAAAKVTKEVSAVRWPTPSAAADILRNLQEWDFVHYSEVDFSLLNLSNCMMQGIALTGSFDGSLFAGANFSCTACYGATFAGAEMRDVRGFYTSFIHCHLPSVSLVQSKLDHTSWQSSFLNSANMEGVRCQDNDFRLANLRDANLQNAFLLRCDFRRAELGNAIFDGSTLSDCDFTGANLKGASFKRCKRTNVKGMRRSKR